MNHFAISPRDQGFTLLEVLVALSIFALMSAIAFRGLNVLLDTRQRVTQAGQKWQDLSRLHTRLQQDFSHLANRPIRDAQGLEIPALFGDFNPVAEDAALFALTRMGGAGQTARSQGLQRFAYRLRNNKVEMLSWSSLDQAPRARPVVDEVFSGVVSMQAAYLDSMGIWQDRWPITGQTAVALPPAAVKLILELASGEKITWQFAVR